MSKNYKKQIGEKIFTKWNPSESINMEDITYIEKIKNKNIAIIHLSNNSEHLDTETLDNFEKDLFDCGFIRVDYGIIANMKYINKIGNDENGKKFIDLGEKRIKVSRRRKKNLKKWIDNTDHL